MNLFKHTLLLIVSILIFGCASTKQTGQDKMPMLDIADEPKNELNLTEAQKHNWQHLDLETDSILGMSVDKAYKFLEGKQGREVVVGVIDTGVDFNHEDLKDVAWVNTDEIANNGIDDDKNGYVDDMHGWNFIGKMKKANFEEDRILANPSIADAATLQQLKTAQEVDVKMAKEQESSLLEHKVNTEQMLRSINNADKAFTKHFGTENYTKKDILAIKNADENLKTHIDFIKEMFSYGGNTIKDIKDETEYVLDDINAQYNKNQEAISGTHNITNYRTILGDNPNDINDISYGDANVQPMLNSESHGSHVSGIIAAKRNNNLGMNGIANTAKIMSLRAVPGDGDEHDKDVALAIRYAVDNGAKVINGSFGKSYSPYKNWVYEAIKYAADNDVLIVNAAGNAGYNIDKIVSYPNDTPTAFNEIADNFIVVGASTPKYDASAAAHFSNYGKQNVDVFAPGIEIYSAMPNNTYESEGGTSMAAPCVAGVAALIRSHYPQLTASQVKYILIHSGTKINLKVNRPVSMSAFLYEDEETSEATETLVSFSDLSVSGSVVNAYNALKMADTMVNEKK